MHKLAFILLIIGGLNWLLFGLAGTDIGSWLGGGDMGSGIARVIYVIVGLAALYELIAHRKRCKDCETKMSGASM